MSDLDDLLIELRTFVAERDWGQFHTPESLSKSIVIEAAELLEEFQWESRFDRIAVLAELADVLTYALLLADRLEADPVDVVRDKLAETRVKYPVEKSRGRSEKYDRL